MPAPYTKIHMPPDMWREHQLLKRRAEWLEISNSEECREHPGHRANLSRLFSDVAVDAKTFSALLVRTAAPQSSTCGGVASTSTS